MINLQYEILKIFASDSLYSPNLSLKEMSILILCSANLSKFSLPKLTYQFFPIPMENVELQSFCKFSLQSLSGNLERNSRLI